MEDTFVFVGVKEEPKEFDDANEKKEGEVWTIKDFQSPDSSGADDASNGPKEDDLNPKPCTSKTSVMESFKCSQCNFESRLKFNVQRHEQESHSDIKLFKCSKCNFESKRKGNLKRHELTHSDVKLFECSQCSYRCNARDNLNTHLLTHLDIKLYKCTLCDYACKQKRYLKTHYLQHAGIKLFKCSECGCEFNCKDHLKSHMLTHRDTKLFKCSLCSYESNYKGGLKSHMLTHSDEKQFQCNQCTYRCKQKTELKRHLLGHSGVKLFRCPDCSYGCNHKGDLRTHMLTHSDLKLFKCSVCGVDFKTKKYLTRHMSTHSSDKIFKCSLCSYKTNQKIYLRKHLSRHADRMKVRDPQELAHAFSLYGENLLLKQSKEFEIQQQQLQDNSHSSEELYDEDFSVSDLVDVELRDESEITSIPHQEALTQQPNNVSQLQQCQQPPRNSHLPDIHSFEQKVSVDHLVNAAIEQQLEMKHVSLPDVNLLLDSSNDMKPKVPPPISLELFPFGINLLSQQSKNLMTQKQQQGKSQPLEIPIYGQHFPVGHTHVDLQIQERGAVKPFFRPEISFLVNHSKELHEELDLKSLLHRKLHEEISSLSSEQ